MIKNKLSRYLLIIVAIIVLSTILPDFFWKIFDKPSHVSTIYYSPVLKQYVYRKSIGKEAAYLDEKGNEYTRNEYEEQLPYIFYHDLDKWGKLPDSLDGYEISISFIRHNSLRMRWKSGELNMPSIDLFPLLESQSEYAKLEFPNHLFRITDRMEFINAEENKVNEEMSELFTNTLEDNGFIFPAKGIFGNITTRKPFDEGYFIVDAEKNVYHLKQVKGNPVIVKTPISRDLNIRKIFVFENQLKEYYGYLLTEENQVYLLTYDDYKLIHLPTEGYDADKMHLNYFSDPAYRTINYDDNVNYYAVTYDTSYHVINSITLNGTDRINTNRGKVFCSLFPFETKLFSKNKYFLDFNIDTHFPLGLISILFSLIILALLNIKKKTYFTENWADFLVVAVTGVYGLIAVLLIKPDVWD